MPARAVDEAIALAYLEAEAHARMLAEREDTRGVEYRPSDDVPLRG